MYHSHEPTLQSRSDEQHFYAILEDTKKVIDRFCAGELGPSHMEEIQFADNIDDAAIKRAVEHILKHPSLEAAEDTTFDISQCGASSLLLMLEQVVNDDE